MELWGDLVLHELGSFFNIIFGIFFHSHSFVVVFSSYSELIMSAFKQKMYYSHISFREPRHWDAPAALPTGKSPRNQLDRRLNESQGRSWRRVMVKNIA
jgi:hypothetical protein